MKDLFLLVFCLCCFVQVKGQDSVLGERVDRYLKPLLQEDLISGALLIAKGDEVLLTRAFGPANREYEMPCQLDTRFRLASVSKQFTAAAVLLLQQQGKLSVSDPLAKYLPDYPGGDKITLHHLLTHTSGVINYSALEDHYRVWTMPHTISEVIARFRDKPLRFEPGSKWEYSNSGYVLLSAVIEKVSGLPFGEFMSKTVFDPLQMGGSGIDDHTKVIPLRAIGHYNQGEGIIQAPYLDIGYTSGAGSLFSTVGDMFKWHRALQSDRLLTQESRKQMFTPGPGDYGCGWFIRKIGEKTLYEHPGGINGFLTSIKYLVEDDLVVITLFNYVSTFARRVNQDLISLALGRDVGPVLNMEGVEVPRKQLQAYKGSYELQPGYDFLVEEREGALWVIPPQETPQKGIPQSVQAFFLPKANAIVQFAAAADGKPMMLFFQSENVFRCPKIKIWCQAKKFIKADVSVAFHLPLCYLYFHVSGGPNTLPSTG